MKRAISLACVVSLVGLSGLVVVSCSSGEGEGDFVDEGVGSVSESASKCAGGKVGDSNYCSVACKCGLGEGDCDNLNECNIHPTLGQLRCAGHTAFFGAAVDSNACTPLHCDNKKLDGNETQVDCGGSCGTFCPAQCGNLPANGTTNHCTVSCPCPAGQGDCDANNAECTAGNVCRANVGLSFGFAATTDVCLAATCSNGVQDVGEDGQDCGPTCLPCSGASQLSFAKGGPVGDHGMDVAIDSAASIIVAGRFGGTASFGGPALVAQGGSDVVVAKYNNAGTHAWSKRFGGTAADGDLGVSVAVDNGRNVYVGGNYRGTIDFGGGHTHTAVATNTDAFIVKLNAAGTAVWSRSFGGASAERIHSLAVTNPGDVFVAGSFASTSVDFGGGARTNAGAQGQYDAFVLRLNTNGGHVYSTTYGSTGDDHAFDVAFDSGLNAYVAGSFQGTVLGMTANGTDPDGYGLKLGPTGTNIFAVAIGGTNTDSALSVGVDVLGPVFGGRFRNTVDFGNAVPVTATGNTSGYAVAYTGAGAYRWHKTYLGSTGSTHATVVAGASTGAVVGGNFQGAVDFGNGVPVTATGTQAIFVLKYDTAGTLVYNQTYAASVTASLLGAVQANGMLGITGDVQGSINLGNGALTAPGGGGDDIFFARYTF